MTSLLVCVNSGPTEINAQDGVLYKGMKFIISSMHPQMIARVHSSHSGPDACVRRARDILFWPGMSSEIKEKVKSYEVCNDFLAKQQKEPLMTHKIPDTPWSKVGQDLFSSSGETYLVTVDYYSDYFELDLLEEITAAAIIKTTKSHFARHGIADMVTMVLSTQAKNSQHLHALGNSYTPPARLSTARALGNQSQPSKLPRRCRRRPSETRRISRCHC